MRNATLQTGLHNVRLRTIFCALLVTVLSGCETSKPYFVPRTCILQPFNSIQVERKKVFEIGAKLQQIPIDANLKAGFTNVLHQEFFRLSDKNISQLLFLQAIDCYLLRAAEHPSLVEIVKPIVNDMAKAVLTLFGASQGISGVSDRLDDNQKEAILKSPFAPLIFARYKEFGIE